MADRICTICFDNERSILFLPCGHFICCEVCVANFKECPVCRREINGLVRPYFNIWKLLAKFWTSCVYLPLSLQGTWISSIIWILAVSYTAAHHTYLPNFSVKSKQTSKKFYSLSTPPLSPGNVLPTNSNCDSYSIILSIKDENTFILVLHNCRRNFLLCWKK